MRFISPKELRGLNQGATTPQKLHTELSRLVLSSKKIVSKVELCNEKSGEYCIKLEGTLDTVPEQNRNQAPRFTPFLSVSFRPGA